MPRRSEEQFATLIVMAIVTKIGAAIYFA